MRKIKEILRLYYGLNLGKRQIARGLSISHTTVSDMIRRAQAPGITWPLPEGLDEAQLEASLYPGNLDSTIRLLEPDMALIHRELRRKGVTLQLLWLEYKEQHIHILLLDCTTIWKELSLSFLCFWRGSF